MTFVTDARCTNSPYSSPIWVLAFDGGRKHLLVHRDILQRAPAFFAVVLAACNNKAPKICSEVKSISFRACHVIYHYLITGLYQSLEPEGNTDVEKQLYDFETAVDVHSSATFVNLPSLRDLAGLELVKICDDMSSERIIQALKGLKVSLANFPELREYCKTRQMHAKERQAKREADAALYDRHNKPSSHQFYKFPIRPDPRILKEAKDARMRRTEKEMEEHRSMQKDRLDKLRKRLAEHPTDLKQAAMYHLAAERASAEVDKAVSEEKSQLKRGVSAKERLWTSMGDIRHEDPRTSIQTYKMRQQLWQGGECDNRAVPSRDAPFQEEDLYEDDYPLPRTGKHDFTAVRQKNPPTEDTPDADSNGRRPVLSPVVKAVSEGWDSLDFSDGSEDDDDSRTLVNSWHSFSG